MDLCCISGNISDSSEGSEVEEEVAFRCKNYRAIREGYSFAAVLRLCGDGENLVIDLCPNNINNDIMLRIVFSTSTGLLIRRSRIEGNWSLRETSVENPFRLDKSDVFVVQLFFTDDYIFIALDGVHLARFACQKCYSDVKAIKLRGNLEIVNYEHDFIAEYPKNIFSSPHEAYLRGRYALSANVEDIEEDGVNAILRNPEQRYLPIPYYAMFDKRFFKVGYTLVIKGLVGFQPKLIKISLQAGKKVWPEPLSLMKMDIHFRKNRITRAGELHVAFNSNPTGFWVDEQTVEMDTEFQPRQPFNLRIKRRSSKFHIFLNKTRLHQYPYPHVGTHVDTCLVQGDIYLIDIIFESH